MNEILKFTIIITIVYNVSLVLIQCVHTLSDNLKKLVNEVSQHKEVKK